VPAKAHAALAEALQFGRDHPIVAVTGEETAVEAIHQYDDGFQFPCLCTAGTPRRLVA
jgi:hypothetical protein